MLVDRRSLVSDAVNAAFAKNLLQLVTTNDEETERYSQNSRVNKEAERFDRLKLLLQLHTKLCKVFCSPESPVDTLHHFAVGRWSRE